MLALFFLLYVAAGAATAGTLSTLGVVQLPLALCAGGVVTALLGQVHLFASGRGGSSDVEDRLEALDRKTETLGHKVDATVARTDAIEATVKEELTERRDKLVTEMRQLESLIDRLARSFDQKLTSAGVKGEVAPMDDAVLREVRDALQEGRVDLHLQPVVSLPQRRVSFYEGFTRLRRADGTLILPVDFLDAGRRARILGVIDNMMLYRSVEVVRRLAARDRRVGVFCNVSAHSLTDPYFFPFFLAHMEKNRDLAGALIFEIRAKTFQQRTPEMRSAMEKLTTLGFRFSIDHTPGLGFDLPRLQDAGVRFVKLNGSKLIEQLKDPAGPRPASSVNRSIEGDEVAAICSRYGVTLIAEKLEEEASVVETLEFGIPFGQGHIFGAPRPIKASLMEETSPPPELIRQLTARH